MLIIEGLSKRYLLAREKGAPRTRRRLRVGRLEVNVLHGASRVLARRHVAWQIEVDPHWLRSARLSLPELVGMPRDPSPTSST